MEEEYQEEAQAVVLTTVFPLPPPFYKNFTKENLTKLEDFKDAHPPTGTDSQDHTAALLALRPELRTLIPPPPPTDGRCRVYGSDLGVPPKTLADYGAEQLVPTDFPLKPDQPNGQWSQDRAYYLLKLTRSMMLNFLELAGILSINPTDAWEKMRDLQMLFYNAHQLVNEYRPHQARYALVSEMEGRLAGLRKEIEGVREMKRRTEELLEELSVQHEGDMGAKKDAVLKPEKEASRKEKQMTVWSALEAEMAA